MHDLPIRLRQVSRGELALERQGEPPQRVKPVRAFPLTHPEEWIALLDERGRSVHLVGHLDELEPDSRAALTQELERLYFLPRIRKIRQIREQHGVLSLEVDTDRGRRAFEVGSREQIRCLPTGRLLLRDLDGNRYELPCLRDLDPQSRLLAETYF
jgi:hypothetical protein